MNGLAPTLDPVPAQAQGDSGTPGGPELRRDPRRAYHGEATIIRCTGGTDRTPMLVRVRDISVSGIGITHSVRLSKGEQFIAVLPPGLADIGRGVLCTVVHVTPMPGGEFRVGARFDRLIKLSPAGPSPTTPDPASPAPQSQVQATPIAAAVAPASVGAARAQLPGQPATPAGVENPPKRRELGEPSRLLTRDECVARAEKAMQARTLSGVVAQVISLAASPRSDLSDLTSLISRDPMLSARILQAANSPSYASTRGIVSTIPEAVRNIGCAKVRDVAASLGVFDAMPACSGDGFNPIRCWQHSFAVATLCQRMVGDAESGPAYLIGLCHDLGEILFHTHFAAEYRQVLDAQAATGRRRDELERKMLGTSHGELVVTILRCLGLPDAIRGPIEAFHKAGISGRGIADGPTRLLRAADFYANGLLLASSPQSPLAPLTKPECRSATRQDEPARPDGAMLRGEIFGLTAMLARLAAKDEAELMTPPYPHKDLRVWLARDPVFSSFDPIAAAMESLGELTVQNRLPSAAEAAEHRAIVVVSRGVSTGGMSALEIARAASLRPDARLPVLWLIGSADGMAADLPPFITPVLWPAPLFSLAEFVSKL